MIPYLLHAALLLSVFWLFYWLLIRKETYYKLNRYFLVSVIALSLLLPLITIPASLSLRPQTTLVKTDAKSLELENLEPLVLTSTKPIPSADRNLENAKPANEELSFFNTWNLEKGLWVSYCVGVSIFLITFLIQFILLLYRKSKLEYVQDDQFRIYELTDDQAPFSFMKWIFINPAKYDYDTYEQILEHEKVHVSQYHFLDKFLAEFLVIIFWFNPFAWLYRKSITNNIEFLTDYEMLGKGVEKETYQYSLLKVSVPQYALNLTTSYNESFLKERIIMMNTKQSSAKSSWKYLLTLPLAFFCMASLNAVNYSPVVSNITDEYKNNTIVQNEIEAVENQGVNVSEDESIDENIQVLSNQSSEEELRQQYINRVAIEEIDMENNSEESITIDESELSVEIENEIGFTNLEEGKPGFWKGSLEGDEVCLAFNFIASGNYHQNQCFYRSEFTNISENSEGEFVLTRDAGKLILRGEFEDGLGEGRFDFESNPAYVSFLDSKGYKGADDSDVLQMFMSDISKDFIENANNDLGDLSLNKLIELAIHTDGESDIEELMKICKKIGHNNPKAKDLISMAIHGVTLDFVDGLMAVTSEDLTLSRVVEAKIHDVDPVFVASLRDNGYPNISLKRVIEMSIHGVDQDDIEALSDAGYEDVDPKYLTEFAIHGVSPKFIRELSQLGYGNFKPRQLVEFAIHGVTPRYIKDLEEAGYNDLSARNLVEAKIHSVDAEDAAKYKEMGLDISVNKLIEFKIHGVYPSYVAELQGLGYNELSPSKIVEGKIHGVSPDRIKEYQELGVSGLAWNKVLEAKIHGVTPKFIHKARDAGYSPKDLSEYTQLKIMGIK